MQANGKRPALAGAGPRRAAPSCARDNLHSGRLLTSDWAPPWRLSETEAGLGRVAGIIKLNCFQSSPGRQTPAHRRRPNSANLSGGCAALPEARPASLKKIMRAAHWLTRFKARNWLNLGASARAPQSPLGAVKIQFPTGARRGARPLPATNGRQEVARASGCRRRAAHVLAGAGPTADAD